MQQTYAWKMTVAPDKFALTIWRKKTTNWYTFDFIQSIFIFPIVFVVLSQLSSIFCFYQKQKHIEFIFFRMLIAHLATYRRAED